MPQVPEPDLSETQAARPEVAVPEVTVLMTVYNGMPHLRQSIESVLSQSLANFRFVIVDDGSNDDSVEYLNSLTDDRIKLIRQENQGTAAAANHGLQYCDTPYVARMDADDIAMPDRLQKQLAFMQQNPSVGIVGAQVAPVGDCSVGNSLVLPLAHEDIFEALMKGRHGLAHSVIMIRNEVLKQVGGYWKFPLIDDWDMMLRVGEASRLANLDQVLLHYRVHSGSLNGSSMWRMHRHIGYAIERAKRRQTGRDQIPYEEFEKSLGGRPIWLRAAERLHVYAMTQYRMAVADIHGSRRAVGYLRLTWAALCSPARTLHRIRRVLGHRRRPNVTHG